MSETEFYRDMKKIKQSESLSRRNQAESDFFEAARLAAQNSLKLAQFTHSHFQISGRGWLINLYPGNQRIYSEKTKCKAPYLELPEVWTLSDVVKAAIESEVKA